MRKLSNEKIERIIVEYKSGLSLRQLNMLLGVSIGSAHKYLSEFNIIKKQNIVKELNSHDERLIGLYVGLWMGDGTQYWDKSKGGYTVKICSNKNDVLLNQFIHNTILMLFGKKAKIINELKTNRAYIRFDSKFVFDFVYHYIMIDSGKKTYSVRLKEKVDSYSREFLEGCLLGLILSDGYLKHVLSFNVVSVNLAENLKTILEKFGFHPYIYIDNREKYHWGDIHAVKLYQKESRTLIMFLDDIIRKLDYSYSFNELKYESMSPRRFELRTS